MFLTGAALLIVGMAFFTIGVDMAMLPMGEGIGIQLAKSSKLVLVLIVCFVIGAIIAIAEPNLIVLAHQVSAIPFWYLILTVAVGVGLFLAIAILRTLFKIRFSVLLIVSYVFCFVLSYFTQAHFIPVAFESGAVVTGPIVVPFILAIGVGFASIRSNKESLEDNFGLVALLLIGPVPAMLILGILYEPQGVVIGLMTIQESATIRDVMLAFILELPSQFTSIATAMGAILLCFIVFQIIFRRYNKTQLGQIAIGFTYTLIGLVLFLTGVNVGFIPVGQLLGSQLAISQYSLLLIPLGALIGYFIVAAEPAVYVLNKQVEEITSGTITSKMMYRGLAIGIAFAVGITMARILFSIPLLWIIIPGYAFSLALSFFVPKIFTSIAFDSGAVCTGPMSATFLLPLALGVADGAGKDLMLFGIGIVVIVAMAPTIVIQFMGLLYKIRTNKTVLAEK
jgi:hypothetical protein